MGKTILSKNQQELLKAFAEEKIIQDYFFLTGGTALAEYYLHHRDSEDLDFFSVISFESEEILSTMRNLKKVFPYKKLEFKQQFHRNLFYFHLEDEVIKTEFTYYPFEQIEKPHIKNGIKIDSLLDIAVNKMFTIFQNPRSRDFIDLYFIVKQKKWSLEELMKKAQIKFDIHVDAIQIGKQFMRVTEIKDYPRMTKKIDPKVWQKFFLNEAKKLKSKVFNE